MKDVYVVVGATGEMGSDIAKKITKNGKVLLVDLDLKKLEKLKTDLKKLKIDSDCLVCDITSKTSIKNLINKTMEMGKFRVLINVAGVSEANNVKTIFAVNLIGAKLLMDAFYKIADNSVVINIASMTARLVPDNFLYNKILLNPLDNNFYKRINYFIGDNSRNAYAFSKKGMLLITEKEVGKWADKNSRVISVSPGAIKTNFSTREIKDNKIIDTFVKNTPISRFGKTEEVTSLVKYLVSDEASFITGTDIVIDGGITSHMKYNDIFKQNNKRADWKVPAIIYILLFLIIPFLVKFLATEYVYTNYITDSFIIYNPLVLIITSAFIAKRKVDFRLGLVPFIVFLISSLILLNFGIILYSLVYGLLAFLVGYIKAIVIEDKERK